jgi:pilus assembly protein CpaB
MTRPRWATLTTAVACGLLAAYLSVEYLRTEEVLAAESTAQRTLVVAARDLAGGALIRAEDLKVISWKSDELPEGFVGTTTEIVGKGLLQAIRANEPLLMSKLASEGEGAGLSILIPHGMRAVSVRVDDVVSVAGFVLPGTRVDVLVTLPMAGEANLGTSRMVLQNLKVLAAGESLQADAEGKAQSVSVVTVLVTPEEAEVLFLATAEGRVQLALRNSTDLLLEETSGAVTSTLLGEAKRTEPSLLVSRAPVARRTQAAAVEVYRGVERSIASF